MFVKVMPVDYKRMQQYMTQVRNEGKHDNDYDIAIAAFDLHLANLAKTA